MDKLLLLLKKWLQEAEEKMGNHAKDEVSRHD